MDEEAIVSQLDSLLVCGEDEKSSCTTKGNDVGEDQSNLPVVYEHQHERFLVAWVLLTRLSQDRMDQVWENYGEKLTYFATRLLSDTGNFTTIDNCFSANSPTGNDDCISHEFLLLHIHYIRLVAQVITRLTRAPPKALKFSVYNAWKEIACSSRSIQFFANRCEHSTTDAIPSSAGKVFAPPNPILALNIDVHNAILTWMEEDVSSSSEFFELKDVWDAFTIAHAITHSLPDKEDNPPGGNILVPRMTDDPDRRSMIVVLENLLAQENEDIDTSKQTKTENKPASSFGTEFLQSLVIGIFELTTSTSYNVSEEFVANVLRWMNEIDREQTFTSPENRFLWHGWLLKQIIECTSHNPTTKTKSKLLSDANAVKSIQKIMLAHAVSPDEEALRPLAWQGMAQITNLYGWSWSTRDGIKSKSASICTWCRLACGEWKIQLEEGDDLSLASPNKVSLLNGCGRLMTSVVEYLAEFEDRPDRAIPLDTNGLLHIRESLEETFSTTSAYLNGCSEIYNSSTTPGFAIVIHVWSRLFSDLLNLSNSKGTEPKVACLKHLVSESDDESLLQPLLHLLSSIGIEGDNNLVQKSLDDGLMDPIVKYMARFWDHLPTDEDHIRWACYIVEIIAEIDSQRIPRLKDKMLNTIASDVERYRTISSKEAYSQSFRLVVDSYVSMMDGIQDADRSDNESRILSEAIGLLEKK